MSIILKNQYIYEEPWNGKVRWDTVEYQWNLYKILSIEDPWMQLWDPLDTRTDIEVEEIKVSESQHEDNERTDI